MNRTAARSVSGRWAPALAALALAVAALSAPAVVVRTLPAMTVVESETVAVEAMKAAEVRSSNLSIFTAARRESDEAIVSGVRLGTATLSYLDEDRGLFAQRQVTVVPSYWDVLRKMFSEDPEIEISIVGDKVVLGGSTANVETLRRADTAKDFDPARIVTQVTYSTAQIGALVRDFLARSGATNVAANVVGREVCLSGRLFDQQSIDQLRKRVEGFVKDFPGITVNTDELRIRKQKILINIEFVAYNDNMTRNLGFSGPESITIGATAQAGFNATRTTRRGKNRADDQASENSFSQSYTRNNNGSVNNSFTETTTGQGRGQEVSTSSTRTRTKGNDSSSTDDSKSSTVRALKNTSTRSRERTHDWSGGFNAKVEGVQATINLLKQNGAAKRLYATTLSTQSGIEAQFQNGGTIYRSTTPGMGSSGDMVTIEYGYIIRVLPIIIDEGTINLDFELDNKQQDASGGDSGDIRLSRYQTKSKYLVRPGEAIVLSGYKYNSESEVKRGTPFLSCIPLIGPRLFGNTANDVDMNEMLLVVTVNWVLEDDEGSPTATEKMNEIKGRKVEVEMP